MVRAGSALLVAAQLQQLGRLLRILVRPLLCCGRGDEFRVRPLPQFVVQGGAAASVLQLL
jgi:hypothetical protein